MAAEIAERSEIATRDQLLLAAGQLMTERRSVHFALADIAARSGVNAALVRYYFGNKSGLLMALLRHVLGPMIRQMDDLLAMPISPRDKLRIHINGMLNAYFRFPYVNQLMHKLLTEEPAEYGPLIAEEIGKPVTRAQKEILQAGVADGSLREIDPAMFYIHITGACDALFSGLFQLRHIFGIEEIDEPLKRKYVDHLCMAILDGIATVRAVP